MDIIKGMCRNIAKLISPGMNFWLRTSIPKCP
ncbi:hypothetical protein BAC2_03539 [uncultured bacterium]|nr:hypothetical protein BAC2_03539 [uncultured bacterium]